MPDIDDLLRRRAGREDRDRFRAELLDPKRPEDRRRIEALLASREVRASDSLVEQLAELIQTRSPATSLSPSNLQARVAERLAGPAWAYGAWAHYPWDGRLVHVLPAPEHLELRTDRNRHKITTDEQRRLRQLRIGVIGLSTGQAVACALAQEGIGGLFRLADFDRLSLSNLNRVRGRIQDVGLPKTIMAARALAELDPYLEIEVFPDGFSPAGARAFFDGESGRLDFAIEVCDSIDVKALVRLAARERGVPVIMVNSEGGVLDIERFDREPARPIFHGLAPPGIDPAALAGADLDTKVAFLLPIVGLDHLSDRMVASLIEAGSTVSTWPQLASGVALGAALATSALRRIALGELSESGRFAVDLAALVADGRGERAVVEPADAAPEMGMLDTSVDVAPLPAPDDAMRAIASAALAAPTGGNAQHCRFVLDGARLEIHRREEARVPAFDPDGDSAWIAAGAAAENAALAASALGLQATIQVAGDALVHVAVAPGPVAADPLAAWIDRRCTNRRRAEPDPLRPEEVETLCAAAAERGAVLEIVEDAPRRALLAELVGAAERLRLLSPAMLGDLAAELRWSPAEAARTRDGIDVRSLELKAGELASLRLMLRAPAMSFLRDIGGGDRIHRIAGDGIAAAPAVGLLTCEGARPEVFVRGGQAVERVWLRAAERGLALAPATSLLFLMRLAGRDDAPLEPAERSAIRAIGRAFDSTFPRPSGAVHVFLFRLGRAEAPTVRSLRRPLDEMLEIRR